MRFLIDKALPPRLAKLLCDSGHNATHVRDYKMHAARDEAVLALAREEDRVLVSADTDFGAILAEQGGNRPAFILFRESQTARAEDYVAVLLPALPVLEQELTKGCVAVFRSGRLRVRSLSLGQS